MKQQRPIDDQFDFIISEIDIYLCQGDVERGSLGNCKQAIDRPRKIPNSIIPKLVVGAQQIALKKSKELVWLRTNKAKISLALRIKIRTLKEKVKMISQSQLYIVCLEKFDDISDFIRLFRRFLCKNANKMLIHKPLIALFKAKILKNIDHNFSPNRWLINQAYLMNVILQRSLGDINIFLIKQLACISTQHYQLNYHTWQQHVNILLEY